MVVALVALADPVAAVSSVDFLVDLVVPADLDRVDLDRVGLDRVGLEAVQEALGGPGVSLARVALLQANVVRVVLVAAPVALVVLVVVVLVVAEDFVADLVGRAVVV